jgi:mannose-6-phosphate isomerase-like protein (cupin superfamily)
VTDGADGGYAISSLDQLAEDERYGGRYGFRKVRRALDVTAFGVNAVVYPPAYPGFAHWHEQQDELYFVHSGTARFEVGDDVHELGSGGLVYVRAQTPRKVSNASETDDLVLLVVGGKDGYVERDGHMVDPADVPRRAAFGS